MVVYFDVILFAGESGLGKSTHINSLFLTDLYPERVIPGAAGNINCIIQNTNCFGGI